MTSTHLGVLASLVIGIAISSPANPSTATAAFHEGEVSLPAFFELTPLAGTYAVPTSMSFTPSGALLVSERAGRVLFHDSTQPQATPVLDLADEVNENGDRGLLCVEPHPGFLPDGGATSWIYVLYTVSPILGEDMGFDEDDRYSFSRLARYRTDTVLGDVVALPASREVLLGNQLPDGSVPDAIASLHTSHSNGSLAFADDGSLLVSIGDGAHYNFPDFGGNDAAGFDDFIHPTTGQRGPLPVDQDSGAFRSQDLRSLAGKILRIDPATGMGYPSNPFYDGDASSHPSRVFALGLRNPFRFCLVPGTGSSDPAAGDPNTLLIGDVGWGKVEELDICYGGENFQWPCMEGTSPQTDYSSFQRPPGGESYPDCQSVAPGVWSDPLVSWSHSNPSSLFPTGIHTDGNGTPLAGFVGSCAIGGTLYAAGGSYPAAYDGRYFFIDYSDQWIKTLEFDGQGAVTGIHDFGESLGRLVGMRRHPLSGDLYCLALADPGHPDGRILWLRYDTNATPTAVAAATPLAGDLPLLVDFDASGSSDPDLDTLTYLWDFGDLSPTADTPQVSHTYNSGGIFEATLTVTDPGGRSHTDALQISVGEFPPVATIEKPTRGQLFDGDQLLQLVGSATDTVPGVLEFDWEVDLFHNDHVHPAFYQADGQNTGFHIEAHGEDGDLYYFNVRLEVTDSSGLVGTDSVFIYPRENVRDVSETWTPISRVTELTPPEPEGLGNDDIEVIRDGDYPRAGQNDLGRQFDTFHNLEQGDDDWIGYEVPMAPGEELRFVGLSFVEGHNQRLGGWFADLDVEVRVGTEWQSVTDLTIAPDYPFELNDQQFFNGVHFDRYEFSFEPIFGEAIRLRGTPGGEDKFISIAELRCRTVSVVPVDENLVDITDQGKVIARVFELTPPNPTGSGNPEPETIRNRTRPASGTTSAHAQFDTSHGGDQGSEDWVGYSFKAQRTFSRLVFQEGLEDATGGALAGLEVQVLPSEGAGWQPVTGLLATPSYPGSSTIGFETFQLDFDPVAGEAIRILGTPQGSIGFFSVAEMRVLAPLPQNVPWSSYCYCGVGPCGNLDPLSGCAHSDGEGARMVVAGGSASVGADDLILQAVGMPPLKFGLIFMGISKVNAPFGDGMRCAGSVQGRRPVRRADNWGRLTEISGLVQWAQLHGQIQPGSSYNFQAWFRDPLGPCDTGFNLSNGLSVTFEP